MVDITITLVAPLALCAASLAERGIIIWEPAPEEPTPKEVPVGKRKNKLKKLLLLPQEIQLAHQSEEPEGKQKKIS